MSKRKGTKAENELLGMLWGRGFATVRSAGSGAMRYPGPDLLSGNAERRLAIECKITKEKAKYFEKEEVASLNEFSRIYGAEPWFAVKFPKTDWLFIKQEDMEEKEKSYLISEKKARNVGLLVNEI